MNAPPLFIALQKTIQAYENASGSKPLAIVVNQQEFASLLAYVRFLTPFPGKGRFPIDPEESWGFEMNGVNIQAGKHRKK